MEYEPRNPWDQNPNPPPPPAPAAPAPTSAAPAATPTRYNTTANWQDPFNPPSYGDPYWDEWIAANPTYRGQGYTGPSQRLDLEPEVGRRPVVAPSVSLIQPFTTPYVPTGSGGPNPMPLPTIAGSVGTIPGAPQFPNIPKFTQPTIDEAMADPGYQFTLQEGDKNLQNWAAARGTLNDSSTAKALIDYGQGAATTQYGNVWDRAMNTYNTNTQTQYLDPFAAQYQNWMSGTVNPTMAQYQNNTANVMHLNDAQWQDTWNAYLQQFRQFQDQRDSTFDKQFKVATA